MFIDELDEKYKDKYQELVESKEKMAQGLLADVQLPKLRLWPEPGVGWGGKAEDPNGVLANDLAFDFEGDDGSL